MIPNLMSKLKDMLSDVQGATFDSSTDSLEAIKDGLSSVGGIEGVQRGLTTMASQSDNATIVAVDLDKSILNFTYYSDNVTAAGNATLLRGCLSSTTNIAFNRGTNVGTLYIAWEVIEYK